ncbi:MAG: twin-arginine translocase subunit TatC [Caulobacteraceae bacterium]|nr:twin-arginine translocase subunit TatC [Caulobacter sp.]RYF94732.1 MAG: twin-arginine translocase subunit TatC [Caulobacteraceae bacterium]
MSTDETEIEASRAPLLDHLVELRGRLIICVIALAIGFGICFFYADPIFKFLIHPFQTANNLFTAQQNNGGKHGPFDLIFALINQTPTEGGQLKLIFTAALELFFAKLKVAGFGALILTFPIIAWQLYRFIAPGLYKRERYTVLPFLVASPVLFAIGAALVYYIMLPFVLWFSLSQQITTAGITVELMPKVDEYLSLVTALVLAFGLCFQLPVVLTLAGLAGLISSKALRTGRRYAIVGVFVVAAVVTPPDPVSQLMLAIPICLLYEISIWCVWLIERRRRKQDETADLAVIN